MNVRDEAAVALPARQTLSRSRGGSVSVTNVWAINVAANVFYKASDNLGFASAHVTVITR